MATAAPSKHIFTLFDYDDSSYLSCPLSTILIYATTFSPTSSYSSNMLASNILPANTMALAALLLISSLSLPSTVEARPGLTRHHKRLIIDRAAGVLARRGKTLCPQKRGETGDLFKPVLNSGDGAIEIVNAAADDDSQNLFTPISPTTANSGRTPLTVLPINSASQSTQNPAGGSLFTPNAAPSSPASTPSSTSVTPASSPLKTPAAAAQTPSSDSSSSSFSSSGPGLFGFSTQQCGASGATSKVSKLAGPNGSMDFLNCGLYSGGGWTPPSINIGQIAAVSLDEAILDPNSPFTPCKPYVGLFDKYAAETGLPPILIAAIAMQESTCNPTGERDQAYLARPS